MKFQNLQRAAGLCTLFLLTLFFSLTHSPSLHADTFVVNSTADEEDGSCDPAPGDCTLREAVAAANDEVTRADVIQFDIPLPATILLNEEMDIESILTIEGPGPDQLTLDAQGNDEIFEVESETGELIEVTIKGMTLTGGIEQEGGAISVFEDVLLTLENCRLTDNLAQQDMLGEDGFGGGVFFTSGSQGVFRNCTLSNNRGEGGGGAIYAQENVFLTLINTEIFDNTTESMTTPGDFQAGGGIYMEGESNLTLDGTMISNNHGSEGGGIYMEGMSDFDTVILNVLNSQITDNMAADEGGGVIVFGTGSTSQVNVFNSLIQGNQSLDDAGGLWVENCIFTILNSTIADNSAGSDMDPDEGQAGGIYLEEGELTIVNSTISGNRANLSGGGIYIDEEAQVALINVSIFNNSADADGISGPDQAGDGGGLFVEEPGSVSIEMANSILAGNNDPNSAPDCSANIISLGFNLIGNSEGCFFIPFNGDLVGTADEPIDPGLDPALANNGGPTPTHALLEGSPAIDAAGGNAGCGVETDQRGVLRPQGARCDMGAFELEVPEPPPPPPPPNGNGNGGGCGLSPYVGNGTSWGAWVGLALIAFVLRRRHGLQ